MTGTVEQVRDAAASLIESSKPGLIIPTFTIQNQPLPPRLNLEKLRAGDPYVTVVSQSFDEQILSRGGNASVEVMLDVSVREKLPTTANGDPDMDRADNLIELAEQIAVLMRDVSVEVNLTFPRTMRRLFKWVRTEPLRDPQGTPYNFEVFRETNSLLITFLPYFKAVR